MKIISLAPEVLSRAGGAERRRELERLLRAESWQRLHHPSGATTASSSSAGGTAASAGVCCGSSLPVTGSIVEGVNMLKRHTKPNPQRNIKGGIVEREGSIHASNVQLVCPECGKATRIGRRVLTDGRKVRICRKCEGVVDK